MAFWLSTFDASPADTIKDIIRLSGYGFSFRYRYGESECIREISFTQPGTHKATQLEIRMCSHGLLKRDDDKSSTQLVNIPVAS